MQASHHSRPPAAPLEREAPPDKPENLLFAESPGPALFSIWAEPLHPQCPLVRWGSAPHPHSAEEEDAGSSAGALSTAAAQTPDCALGAGGTAPSTQ